MSASSAITTVRSQRVRSGAFSEIYFGRTSAFFNGFFRSQRCAADCIVTGRHNSVGSKVSIILDRHAYLQNVTELADLKLKLNAHAAVILLVCSIQVPGL